MKKTILHFITAVLKIISIILMALPAFADFDGKFFLAGGIGFVCISAAKDLLIALADWIDNGKRDNSFDPTKLGLVAVCFLALGLTSCGDTPFKANGIFIGYTGEGIEVTGIPGEITGAGYDLKKKTAYLHHADGSLSNLKITGAGLGANQLALYLEGGSKVLINLKDGTVTTSSIVSTPSTAPAK